MQNCYNVGTVDGLYCAGFVEGCWDAIMTDCGNYGTVNHLLTGKYVGSLCVYVGGDKVVNCFNKGQVFMVSLGGALINTVQRQTDILNCYNVGSTTFKNDSKGSKLGGLIDDARTVNIINCFNATDLSASLDAMGGILADNFGNCSILNCFNIGDIYNNEGGAGTGGLVGQNRSSIIMDNCFNIGNVQGRLAMTGGILGYAYADLGELNCSRMFNIDTLFYGGLGSGTMLLASELNVITNNSVTIDGQTKTIIQALNQWVTANKGTYPELKYWSWDSVNNVPVFVDSI